MKSLKTYIAEAEQYLSHPQAGDEFDIEIARDEKMLSTYIIETKDDEILLAADQMMFDLLENYGYISEEEINEGWKTGAATLAALAGLSGAGHFVDSEMVKNSATIKSIDQALSTAQARGDTKGIDYYKKLRQDVKDEIDVKGRDPQDAQGKPIIVQYKDQRVTKEAKYHGREVPLNKPMRGDVKKSKVYVKDPSTGNIKKVNFGDPNMKIKKSNPARRKSFRARHNCDNPGPKTKARYWSCRAW
jgi:hypothetical protein